MSLVDYQHKRKFNKTPEPTGKLSRRKGNSYVVQKHQASHLHYDFRLELNGVLKSWAVPKGPSLDPNIKRLAVAVEDHPYSYRKFEGIIPEGNYGAGKVEIWDEGTYFPTEYQNEDKSEMQKKIRQQLHGGKLNIYIKGKKLRGVFHLIKPKDSEKNWLLKKSGDEFAQNSSLEMDETAKSRLPKNLKPML